MADVANYLVLRPEATSISDFIKILIFSELNLKDFAYSLVEYKVAQFRLRWIIFISLLFQKILLYLKVPMAVFGWLLEMCLNCPAFNGGYLRLFFNIITGRVVRPDKSSARFKSIIGHLDKRTKLDTEIKDGDCVYNASLAMMASKVSYENEAYVENVVINDWKMEFLGFQDYWNDFEEIHCTQAFMFQNKTSNSNLIVVAFRGTEPFETDDWRTDIDLSWYEFRGIGKVHSGFMKALGLQKSKLWPKEIPPATDGKMFAYYAIREKLRNLIRDNEDAKIMVTGHSLGGALAILFVSILAIHEEENLLRKLEGVYTFGQPRVGDEQFGEYMRQKMRSFGVKYFRYVYCHDMVPRVPFDDKFFFFKHFGPCLHFNSLYKGQVLEEEPYKNYFSILSVMPKILNSTYELIRSFFIHLIRGEEYKEGWLMRYFRSGVLIPGVCNHMPVDYVNLTRLRKLPCHVYNHGPYTKFSTKTEETGPAQQLEFVEF